MERSVPDALKMSGPDIGLTELEEGGGVGEIRELTFLATDIVGSSALHRRFPIDMLAAIDTHDRILHGIIRRFGGNPFKHTGDGVMAAFERPLDAVQAAVEANRAIRAAQWGATGPLQIRWGIHIGTVRARGGDFFGSVLSSASRLESAANPDQILISQTAYDRIGARAAEGVFSVTDLGHHHFKGVDSLHVLQINADGLPQDFPPLRGKRESVHTNLPANLSSFLGREEELSDLRRILAETRVLTLLGPGGIGKTRLSLELLRSAAPSFPGGAWGVQLSSLEEESDLWAAIAATFDIEPVPGADYRDRVIDHLRQQRALILMDNCEHVLDAVSDLVADLCAACGELTIVNTSRRVLGLPGEVHFHVPPLADASAHDPQSSTAVQLFIERARLANPKFDPSGEELATILRICRSLDNMPLAIEIAVAQLRRFPLERIARDAANPLDFKPSRRQKIVRHQHTLRRMLQWSYDLLDGPSRDILQRLSVFSGPFHEEQALAVCAVPDRDADKDELDILDSIEELLDSSLLNSRISDERVLSMLSTVQTFGREKLAEAGLIEELERRHGEVYAARVEALSAAFASESEREIVGEIFDELPNLRSAFERALSSDLGLAARLTAPLLLFNYFHRGAETGDWAGRIMTSPGADDLEQAPVLLAAAASHAFHEFGHPKEAASFIERGLAIEAQGERSSRGWLEHVAGQIAFWSGRPKTFVEHHETCIQQARAHGDRACEIVDMSMAAFVKARTGDEEGAALLIEQLNVATEDIRQPSLIGYLHFAQGGVSSFKDPTNAIAHLETAAEWAELAGNTLGLRRTRQIIADIRAEHSGPEEALAIQIEAIGKLPEHGVTIYLWAAINRLLMPLAKLQADEHLAVLTGALQQSPLKLNTRLQSEVDTARERLGAERFDAAAARGQQFDQYKARDYAINVVAADRA